MSAERVLLVIPPGESGTTPNREGASGLGAVEPGEGGFRYPPHTVAAAAAELIREGYDVSALDAVALGYDLPRSVAETLSWQADLIAVYVSWATRDADTAFLAALRRADAATPRIVAFGVSTRHMAEVLGEADHVLEGEPERALAALCGAIWRQGAVPRVVNGAGMGMPDYDEHGFLRRLDALAHPAWHVLPVGRYPALSVLSSRGCDHGCAWCPYVVAQGNVYRAHSTAHVVDGLRELVTRYRPQRVIFRDPVFARERQRVVEICHGVLDDPSLAPGRNLRWECESRPEHLDGELLRLMSLAGCVAVKVGLETTNPALLEREGRLLHGQRAADYLQSIARLARDCARWGVACRLFALVGLPGQSADMAEETARFVESVRPDTLSVKTLMRYPGIRTLPEPVDLSETRVQIAALHRAQEAMVRLGPRRASRWRRLVARGAYQASKVLRSGHPPPRAR